MTAAARPGSAVSRGAAWSLLYLASVRLGTFGVSVEVARLLGPIGTGAFGVALQASGLATFVGAFGVGQALAQRLAQAGDPSVMRRLCRSAAWIVLTGTLLVALVLAVAATPLARVAYRDPSLASTLLWCAPLTMAAGVFLVAEGALQGLRRFRALALWGLATAACDVSLGFFAAHRGIEAVYAVRAAVRVVATLVGLRLALSGIARPSAPSVDAPPRGALARTLLQFAGPTFLASAMIVLGQTVVRLLLIRGSGLEPAGQYQVGDTVAQGLVAVPLAASVAFLPAIARDRAQGGVAFGPALLRALRRVTGFNLPLCLGVIALGPMLVPLVFGARYGPATGCLQLLAVAYAYSAICSVLGTVALGRAELGTILALNLGWLAALTGVLLLGQSTRGAEGGALALAFAYVMYLVPGLGVALRRWKLAPSRLGPPILCTLALPVAALLAMRAPGLPGWVGIALSLAAALAVFRAWAWSDVVAFLHRRSAGGVDAGAAA